MDKRLVTALGWTILTVWVVGMILDAATTYDPPATLHALMTMLAGAAFGNALRRDDGDDK